jgi:hypothetical protein
VLCCVVWALAFWPSPAKAGNPDLRWRTLETEHFYVHYYAGEEEVAERVAAVAERAYGDLSVAYGHRVYLKTHIRVVDTTDVANGRATANPYAHVTAYVTAPTSLNVLEAYDDWIDILITHELVHVVHLDTVHGVPRLINAIFGFGVLGKITTPNLVAPRWIIEGVATFEESDDTSHGRHRSAQFDMYLRMAVLDRGFHTLDQLSSGARLWPHGTSVYLYGLHLMHYIASRYGTDKLRELSHIYARQAIPFGINRAIKKVLGVDFYQLWDEFKRDTKRRFEAQGRRIRARGLRQGRRLTYSGETTRHPFWSADDAWIYFYGYTGHDRGGLKRIRARGGRIREGVGIGRQGVDLDVERVIEVDGVTPGAFVGADDDIILDMRGTHDYRYRWSDPYRWRGGDPRKMERLTFGLRASEASVSPDGRTAAFRRNDVAQSRLAFLDLATLDVTEVAPASRLSQVYTPRWAPDGKRVAYSGWREGGYRDVYVYDRESRVTTRITADRFMDLSPTWTPDGRYVIFTSDRDDIYNLYAYDTEDGSVNQVSNVLGGAFEPSVSHDGTRIAYVGFSSRGYDLWVMELDPDKWLPAMPAIPDLPTMRDPKPKLAGQGDRPATLSSKRYRAYRTFYPRTLFPTALVFQSSAFGTDLGVNSSIQDVLGFHSLAGTFRYLLPDGVPVGSVSYVYNQLFPAFRLGFGRGYAVRNGFRRFDYDHEGTLEDGTPSGSYVVSGYRERITRADAAMTLPVVRHPRHSVSATTRYRFTRYSNLDEDDLDIDPNAPATSLPEVGDVAQVDLSVAYDNQESVRYGYTAQSGRRISLGLSVLDEALGGQFSDLQVVSAYTERIPMPWRGHQVLALRLSGGASARGMRRRGAYYVGGLSENQDVIRSLVNRTAFSTTGALRGYAPGEFSGRYFSVLNTEYRVPIADVDRGVGTLPLFLSRVALNPFCDVGSAWSGDIDLDDVHLGAGATLVFVLRLGYGDTISLFLQYAHGFDDEVGLDVFRAMAARTF